MRRVIVKVAVAVAATALLGACGSGSGAAVVNEDPTSVQIDAYVVASAKRIARQAGAVFPGDSVVLGNLSSAERKQIVEAAIATCTILRDEPQQIALRFELAKAAGDTRQGRELKWANESLPDDVEHFCPSLRDELERQSP